MQIGLAAMVVAALVLVGTIDVELNETGFKLSLALFGVGAGLMMSQLGNVIMSSAPPAKTNEAGGLQGTAQNLGASLGTALIGSVLLTGLLTGFQFRIAENPALSEPVRAEITAATEQGIEIVTTEQANAAAHLGRPQPSRGGRRHRRLRRLLGRTLNTRRCSRSSPAARGSVTWRPATSDARGRQLDLTETSA